MKPTLLVSLKIPDTTAITAFQTLKRLGYKDVKKLEREDYYEFDISGDVDSFSKKIVDVDVLVNSNKHSAQVVTQHEKEYAVSVLVTDTDDTCEGLLKTLRERLGLTEITSMRRGTLWHLTVDAYEQKEIAEKITKQLLCNEHYQEFEIL